MPRGGFRPGAGRKAGSANRKTREIADGAAKSGLTPLDYLLTVMRDEGAERRERVDAAKAAAPYIHPRLNSVEIGGKADGNPIRLSVEDVGVL